MEEEIGKVTHYFSHIPAAIIKLSAPLKKGDRIHIKGHTTDFEQVVEGMQIEHKDIEEAKEGQEIGVKVEQKTRDGDTVFRVT